nr:hypothetical protein [Tanacetum cinerariifolium]
MARLAFCDYHNMIAIMKKYEHDQDFYQIVDFVEASHIRYALTFNPTVYVSHIRQFWSTARIETTKEGTKILTTVDGKLRTVSESSIRRNIKLNDEEGISIIPEELGLLRRARIAQSSALPPVADEPASPLRDVSQCEACHTDSGFEADQDRANIAKTSTLPSDSTPRVTSLATDEGSMQHKLDELTALCTSMQRQQSEMVAKFEAHELEINSLKARIKVLEDKDRGVAKQSGDDAPIKGRMLDEREEAAKRVSDDSEEMATVLTSMDAASILTSGGVQMVPTVAEVTTATVSIPTSSGVVSTASPTIPTAALIFTTATNSTSYIRRKGKEKMVEPDTPKKKKLQKQINVQVARELEEEMARDVQRMNKQIARDAEIARIHAEEELQMLIDGLDINIETVAKYLKEYDQFAAELPFERRIELISDLNRFVTAAKQARDLHSVNFDQFYASLKHNEKVAKRVQEMRQRFPKPLSLLANNYNLPPSYNIQQIQKNQALRERVVNPVENVRENQPRVIKCYNSNGEGHIAKECTAKKMVKDSEWFKDEMLLAQAHKAGVVLNDEQQDFLADSLEETNDCDDL